MKNQRPKHKQMTYDQNLKGCHDLSAESLAIAKVGYPNKMEKM